MAGIQKSKMETKSLNNDGQIMEHKKTVSILNKILWKIMTTNKETD